MNEAIQVQQERRQEEAETHDVRMQIEEAQPELEEPEPVQEQIVQKTLEISSSLPLPEKMRLLLQFQQCLDTALNFSLARQQTTTFTLLRQTIEGQTQRNFRIAHFQQILTMAPHFYNHRWEMKGGKPELIITIPSNIEEVISSQVEASPDNLDS